MKEYKALKSFSSPRFGNVTPGDPVEVESCYGDAMVTDGFLIETKPAPAPESKKESKPKPVAKKKVKGE